VHQLALDMGIINATSDGEEDSDCMTPLPTSTLGDSPTPNKLTRQASANTLHEGGNVMGSKARQHFHVNATSQSKNKNGLTVLTGTTTANSAEMDDAALGEETTATAATNGSGTTALENGAGRNSPTSRVGNLRHNNKPLVPLPASECATPTLRNAKKILRRGDALANASNGSGETKARGSGFRAVQNGSRSPGANSPLSPLSADAKASSGSSRSNGKKP
jgi:hypothetical protein